MRIINSVMYDIKFQYRHGFYYAYLFVTILYIVSLNLIPDSIKQISTVLIIFTDPSVLGAFFIGAIFILERSQNTIENLFVTPLRIREYIISKVFSLTLLSLLSSLLIVIFGYADKINFIYFILGVLLTSMFYTLLGLILALFSKTVNQYFLYSLISIIFALPLLDYLNIIKSFVFYLLPGNGSLIIIASSLTNQLQTIDFIYSFGLLVLWIIIAYRIVNYVFNKKVILKIGG